MVAQCVFVLGSAKGQGDLNLIQNGGFETGSLTDWTTDINPGIVVVDTTYDALGPVVNPNPTDGGSHFAVMSPEGEEDTTLSQNPAIPAGFSQPVTLSFNYDLIAKALAANETAAEQDATLNVTMGGVSVFSETYAEAGGHLFSTMDATGQTGWETESITLTTEEFNDIETHGVNLKFSVDEVSGDQQPGRKFDLAATIDDVELNYTTVPEPAPAALLLGGVLSTLCFAKRQMA